MLYKGKPYFEAAAPIENSDCCEGKIRILKLLAQTGRTEQTGR